MRQTCQNSHQTRVKNKCEKVLSSRTRSKGGHLEQARVIQERVSLVIHPSLQACQVCRLSSAQCELCTEVSQGASVGLGQLQHQEIRCVLCQQKTLQITVILVTCVVHSCVFQELSESPQFCHTLGSCRLWRQGSERSPHEASLYVSHWLNTDKWSKNETHQYFVSQTC